MCMHMCVVCVCVFVRYTVLFVTACESWELLNTEESNNKSTESRKAETDFKAISIKFEILQKLG